MLTVAHDAPVDGVIAMGARIVSWDETGKIKLWDAASGDLLLELDHGYPLHSTNLGVPLKSVQVNASGTRLLAWNNATSTCACDLHAHIWDIDPESATYGQVLVSVSQSDPPDYVAGGGAMWSPDETLLITWSRDGSAHLWDAATGAELALLQQGGIIWGAAWKSDSSRLIMWSNDKSAAVWNIADVINRTAASPIRASQSSAYRFSHRDVVWGASWSPDERMILTWSFDKNAALWDANSGSSSPSCRTEATCGQQSGTVIGSLRPLSMARCGSGI